MRRRWKPFLAVALMILAAGGLAAYLSVGQSPGDVSNPDVEFTAPPEKKPPARESRKRRRVLWPVYGYDFARTHYLDVRLRPPFRRTWKRGGSKLLEFPPVIAKGRLHFVKNNGEAYALSTRTGRVWWRRRIARLNASSPAWSRGRLFIATLEPGGLVALSARTGRVLWVRKLPSRTESSPLAVNGRVYFGSESGTVYCLRASDGKVVWTYRAGGAVKAGLALSRGLLYFGDYSGSVTAIRVGDGRQVWKTGTTGRSFGRSGNFYSTPAVAFGRVYLGSTDGRVYSLSARSGRVAWTKSTGGYVYASPAVADTPGTRPSVYIGSYDGRFYALDARTGSVRWAHRAGGKISGGATVVGRVVYFSNLSAQSTTGLDVRSGRPVFRFGRGAYNPVVADTRRIYLTGYSSQYAFEPRRKARRRGRAAARRHEQRVKRRARAKQRAARRHRRSRR